MPSLQRTRYLRFSKILEKQDLDTTITKIIRQSAALLAAIKEYEANKWKTIGAKVGKPAKVIVSSPL